jgi:hypothetical protein
VGSSEVIGGRATAAELVMHSWNNIFAALAPLIDTCGVDLGVQSSTKLNPTDDTKKRSFECQV